MTMPMLAGASRMRPPPEFNGYLWWDFTKRHSLPPGFTYTRGGEKRQWNPFTGKYEAYGANVYAPDYDPATGLCRGFRSETAATNLITYSSAPSAANGWQIVGLNVAAGGDAIIAGGSPLAVTTAAGVSQHYIGTTGASLVSGSTYTGFIIFKYTGSQRYVQFLASNGPVGTVYVNYDLADGSETAYSAGTSTILYKKLTPLGLGFYRFEITFTAIATAAGRLFLGTVTSGTAVRAPTWDGDGTSTLEVHHAQLVSGTRVSSPIVTGASANVRQADVMSMLTLPAWFDQSKYSIFMELELEQIPDTLTYMLAVTDGTANEMFFVYTNNSAGPVITAVYDDGVLVGSASASNVLNVGVNKIAASVTVNSLQAVKGGGAGAIDTSLTMPTVNRIMLSSSATGASAQINGWIRKFGLFPNTLSAARMQALTA